MNVDECTVLVVVKSIISFVVSEGVKLVCDESKLMKGSVGFVGNNDVGHDWLLVKFVHGYVDVVWVLKGVGYIGVVQEFMVVGIHNWSKIVDAVPNWMFLQSEKSFIGWFTVVDEFVVDVEVCEFINGKFNVWSNSSRPQLKSK